MDKSTFWLTFNKPILKIKKNFINQIYLKKT